jgi:hypothetical protein
MEACPLEGLVRGHHIAAGSQYYARRMTMPADNNYSQNLPKTNQMKKTNSAEAAIL